MKKIVLFGAVLLCGATLCARPHHGGHHGNKGLHLAADIVNLVGAGVHTVAAVVTPRPVVVHHAPPPPPPVVVHHAPPPPPPVVVHHVPHPRPVIVHPAPHPRPAPHHGPGYRGPGYRGPHRGGRR